MDPRLEDDEPARPPPPAVQSSPVQESVGWYSEEDAALPNDSQGGTSTADRTAEPSPSLGSDKSAGQEIQDLRSKDDGGRPLSDSSRLAPTDPGRQPGTIMAVTKQEPNDAIRPTHRNAA